jgi:hypothetical protein
MYVQTSVFKKIKKTALSSQKSPLHFGSESYKFARYLVSELAFINSSISAVRKLLTPKQS